MASSKRNTNTGRVSRMFGHSSGPKDNRPCPQWFAQAVVRQDERDTEAEASGSSTPQPKGGWGL